MVYHPLSSGEQIRSIINSPLKNTFLKFIFKRLGINGEVFFKIYQESKDDFEIYIKLKEKIKLSFNNKEEAFISRAVKRTQDISDILNNLKYDLKIDKYLDVGSDDCLIPFKIAQKLNI